MSIFGNENFGCINQQKRETIYVFKLKSNAVTLLPPVILLLLLVPFSSLHWIVELAWNEFSYAYS